MKVLTRGAIPEVHALRCDRCAIGFRPSLTGWACPVCGWESEQPETTGVARWISDPGNRIVVLVAGATAANAILLLVLAITVSRAN